MANIRSITPCLWFDGQAEEAVDFYLGIFPNSRETARTLYGEAGKEFHQKEPGTVLTISFELSGSPFTALNGGSQFKFTEAISFQVFCETQEDVDYFWNRLSEGGDPQAQQCGWIKDRFGISWQIVPTVLLDMIGDQRSEASQRAMTAMMGMKKLDIAALKQAYEGAA